MSASHRFPPITQETYFTVDDNFTYPSVHRSELLTSESRLLHNALSRAFLSRVLGCSKATSCLPNYDDVTAHCAILQHRKTSCLARVSSELLQTSVQSLKEFSEIHKSTFCIWSVAWAYKLQSIVLFSLIYLCTYFPRLMCDSNGNRP
jgi:hypothetical protein